MAHLTPRQKREAVARYYEVRKDEHKQTAYDIVGREYGIAGATVSRIVKDAGSVPETSSDYEIRPSTIPQPQRHERQGAIDEDGRYELTDRERWLILPDTQVPFHDQRTLANILEYARTQRYDGCIQLGDFMDWDFCSRWSSDNVRKAEGQRFLEEYLHGNAVLDDIQDAVRANNPDCQLIVIEGNHDWRIENVVNKTPALAGLIEMEKNLRFAERKAVYWKYWTHKRPLIIGKAYFIHGDFIGTHHAKKTADSYGRSVFYGHTHTLQAYTKTSLADDSIQCWSLGTLSRFDLEYMGHRPSSWQQGFAEFFFEPDGYYNHYFTNVFKHSFTAINGERYGD